MSGRSRLVGGWYFKVLDTKNIPSGDYIEMAQVILLWALINERRN